MSSHHITFRTEFAFKLKAQNPIENESGCFKLSLQKVRRIHVNVILFDSLFYSEEVSRF